MESHDHLCSEEYTLYLTRRRLVLVFGEVISVRPRFQIQRHMAWSLGGCQLEQWSLNSRLEAIAVRLEAILSRLEAIAIRLEAIPIRLEWLDSWMMLT